MTDRQPSVCTDAELRAEICSTSDAPRREKALERFVRGAFGHLFNSLAGYAINNRWICPQDKFREVCADAYVEFKKNTGKAGFAFQTEDICGYFFKIARNILSQRLDFGPPMTEEFDPRRHDKASSENPHSDLERNEQHQMLRDALQKLTPEEREILALYADGFKNTEIAAHMQEHYLRIVEAMRAAGFEAVARHLWKEDYTKLRVSRAKQKLRDIFGK